MDNAAERGEPAKMKLSKRAAYKLSAAKTATVTILNVP
jgi:hypothetical protein